jgi:glycosyltransferase involved in cell wall biosynthesis
MRGPDDQTVALQHVIPLGNLGPTAMRRRLSLAAVFVSLAIYEPFGLAIVEAALSGCALVLSDIPTFRELWDGAALFCAPQDALEARAAIRRLTEDRELRVELAAAAQRRALGYTAEACAESTLAVYRRVLGGAARRRAVADLRAAG